MLLGLAVYIKKSVRETIPELTETSYYWPAIYGSTTLALFVIFGEIFTFHLVFAWPFVIALIAGIYGFLTVHYFKYKKEKLRRA